MREFCYPMTDEQKKRISRQRVEDMVYGVLLGLFVGIVLGYAWRIAQLAN